MRRRSFAYILAIAVFLLTIVIFVLIISVPLVNNRAAEEIVEDLLNVPLPENTHVLESLSVTGKLTGNGNGMQYLGVILIESELSMIALDEYYASYRQGAWDFRVKQQTGNKLDIIENGDYYLSHELENRNAFLVYTWGSCDYFWKDWDWRGH